jgi:biopolymer transport protein ExbD
VRKRRFFSTHEVGKVNVTPMIDVVMCLIIFYLLVGKLAMTNRVDNLPSSGSGSTANSASAVIVDIVETTGDDEPVISVDGTTGDLAGLEAVLTARGGGTPGKASGTEVQIRASKDLPYAKLAPVLAVCRRAGLTSVRLVAERRP